MSSDGIPTWGFPAGVMSKAKVERVGIDDFGNEYVIMGGARIVSDDIVALALDIAAWASRIVLAWAEYVGDDGDHITDLKAAVKSAEAATGGTA